MPKTLLAFDYGLKKVGVAIGNTLTGQARPLTILYATQRQQRYAKIDACIQEWQPDEFVVGLPLTTAGQEQLTTVQCRHFADWLMRHYHRPVHLQDERDSSLQAQEIVGCADDDAVAAMIILQRYLSQL